MGQQSLIYSFVARGTVVLAEPIRFSSAPSFFSYQIHGLFKLSQMEEGSESCSTHLIEGDGTFNFAGIENFLKEVKLAECGLSYAVVSIMGPQSSGLKQLKVFGWQNALALNPALLLWIWRVLMEENEERMILRLKSKVPFLLLLFQI